MDPGQSSRNRGCDRKTSVTSYGGAGTPKPWADHECIRQYFVADASLKSEREAARELEQPGRPVRLLERQETVAGARVGESLDVKGVERVHVEPQPITLS